MNTMFRIVALAALLAPAPALAQAKPPEALVKVRNDFAAAVIAKNEAAAAALSRFPLENNVYQEPKTVSRKGFKGLLGTYAHFTKCLKSDPLTPKDEKAGAKSKRWMIDCDGNIVHFGEVGGKWLHIGYENANE